MSEDVLIYEDKYQQNDFKKSIDELMDDEQQKRVQYYLKAYQDGKAKVQDNIEEWEEIHRAYKGERTDATEGGKINPVAENRSH